MATPTEKFQNLLAIDSNRLKKEGADIPEEFQRYLENHKSDLDKFFQDRKQRRELEAQLLEEQLHKEAQLLEEQLHKLENEQGKSLEEQQRKLEELQRKFEKEQGKSLEELKELHQREQQHRLQKLRQLEEQHRKLEEQLRKNLDEQQPHLKEEQQKSADQKKLTDERKAQLLKQALGKSKRQFNNLLGDLQSIRDELDQTAQTNPKYENIAGNIKTLYQTLSLRMQAFFDHPTAEGFKQVRLECEKAIKAFGLEAQKHRGWHRIDPVLRGILGVLAAIAVIPALIVEGTSQQGYIQTFFATPPTETSKKMTVLESQFEAQMGEIGANFASLMID